MLKLIDRLRLSVSVHLLFGLLALGLPLLSRAQTRYNRQYVTVAGKKMSYTSFGLANRRPGDPVLIFEAGFNASGSNFFTSLYPALSKFAAGIGYDRNGDGGSDEDTTLATDADLMRRLHAFLAAVHVPPPYMLVGHSMGGPYIRLFTALYPTEIAGLLFLDPTDFMLTAQQDEQLKTLSGGRGAKAWIAPHEDSLANDTLLSLRSRHRFKRLANLARSGLFGEYTSLDPLPDIPVGVLLIYNKLLDSSYHIAGGMPRIIQGEQFNMENFAAMIRNNQHSFLMLLPRYPHTIGDPDLLVSAIHRIYQATKNPQRSVQAGE